MNESSSNAAAEPFHLGPDPSSGNHPIEVRLRLGVHSAADAAADPANPADPADPADPAAETSSATATIAHDQQSAVETVASMPWTWQPDQPLQLPAELIILGRNMGPLSLHVQRLAPSRGSAPRATAGQSDAAWRAAFRSLRAAQHPTLPRPDARLLDQSSTVPPRHGPIAWCERTSQVVRPLCSTCLAPLRTLRDERELQRRGLPSYRGTAYRFLACQECLRAGREIAVYTEDAPPLADAVATTVRQGSRVHRDLARHLSQSGEPDSADALASHPCFTCAHRTACYPQGSSDGGAVPAEAFLHSVSYHDAIIVPSSEPASNATFQELAAYLGGRTPSPRSAFWYYGDMRGNFALECLHLKLEAFTRLTEGLLQLHQTLGRPHLGLSSKTICGKIPETDRPGAAWEAQIRFGDLASAYPIGGFDSAAVLVPWLPLPGGHPAYAHAELRQLAPHRGSGKLHFERVSLISSDTGDPIRLEVEANLETRDLPEVALWNAAFRIEGILGGQNITVFARALESDGDSTRLRGTLQPGDTNGPAGADRNEAEIAELLEDTTAPPESSEVPANEEAAEANDDSDRDAWERIADALRELSSSEDPSDDFDGSLRVEFTAVSAPGAPSDIAALGVLWLQFLLCNDSRHESPLEIEQLVQLRKRLQPAVDQSGPPRPRPSTDELIEAFGELNLDARPQNVIYRSEDREDGAATSPDIWGDALYLGLEMAAPTRAPLAASRRVAGSAGKISTNPFSYSLEDPAAKVRDLCETFRSLAARTRSTLLGTSGDNRFVLEACADFRADLEEALRALESAPPEPQPEEPDSAEVTIVMRRPPLGDDADATRF